jgi:hypothetical protein
MLKLFTVLLFLSSAAIAAPRAYKITVFAESGAEARAQEFIRELISTEPFRQLHEKQILIINDEPLLAKNTNCKGGYYGIPRLAQCNTSSLKKACRGSDLCPIFTNVPFIGAGGKPFPISSSTFPWTTMLHEFIHTFGFSDEYSYTATETHTYCGSLMNSPNEVQLSTAKIYQTKIEAEQACVKSIAWCAQALREGNEVVTEVHGGFKIGSPLPPSCPNNTLGVYLGAGCMRAQPESTFRPYFCPTIMGYPKIGQDYCEVQERHAIIARMPNIIPPYFQQSLFESIIKDTGTRGITFEKRPAELPETFIYGIPEVDGLILKPDQIQNKCSKIPLESP